MEETTVLRCLSLMKSKEDTSKFVAISILPSILSKKPSLSYECWEAMDFKWIDRLLRSSGGTEESSEYKILAVNILISFASFPKLSEHPDMINRIPCLISILEGRKGN